jgi:nucleoside-diphosphate-sugar epimerase
MRVLVTGGSGVIGEGLLPVLLAGGHRIRLLSRSADDAAREWPPLVEPFVADVTRPEQLRGAADECDAVVHITGIVVEEPPDVTYDRVNVDGTRHLLAECTRAGSPKFIYISSLAADRGTSAYHASKRSAEALVRAYHAPWIILRCGNVFGPGDDVLSKLLTIQRTLPVIPVIGDGEQPFQPIWYADLGKAIARAIESDEVSPGIYDVAGTEVTTLNQVLDRFQQLTDRSPLRVPIPEVIAAVGTRIADSLGIRLPANEAQFKMLVEHNVVASSADNALTKVFQVTPTPLASALATLVDVQPEQQPSDGVGGMERKRFWADISKSRFTPERLMAEFRRRCTELMPIEFSAEPGTPQEVVEGATMTAHLPLRGNVQIRVVEVTPRVVIFATLRGHPLAGVVRFAVSDRSDGVQTFGVSVFARAATMIDWMAISTLGTAAQNTTWRTVVERVADMSGGEWSKVEQDSEVLDDKESQGIEAWIEDVISARKRAAHAEHVADS